MIRGHVRKSVSVSDFTLECILQKEWEGTEGGIDLSRQHTPGRVRSAQETKIGGNAQRILRAKMLLSSFSQSTLSQTRDRGGAWLQVTTFIGSGQTSCPSAAMTLEWEQGFPSLEKVAQVYPEQDRSAHTVGPPRQQEGEQSHVE